MSTASRIEYSDPDIRAWERQLRVLRTQQRAITNDDEVASAAIVQHANGRAEVFVFTKQGNVWKIGTNGGDVVGWQHALPPVPNTPAADVDNEAEELERKIRERKRTRGGEVLDDDIADLVGEEEP